MEELSGAGPEEGLTSEEQALVVSLQAKHGNKLKKIVAKLPGHTPKRLGKSWGVFKEKHIKLQSQRQKNKHFLFSEPDVVSL